MVDARGGVSNLIHSALKQALEDDREVVEVTLRKGPAAYCSEQTNGKTPRGYHVNKTYKVTIEAGAHRKLARNHSSRKKFEVLSPDGSQTQLQAQSSDAASNVSEYSSQLLANAMHKREDYYARAQFRHQRAPSFEKAKRFPALANHRLVPEWRGSRSHYDDSGSHLSARQQTQRRLIAPSILLAVRQHVRQPPLATNSWHPHLNVSEITRECSRAPLLCNEAYSPRVDAFARVETEESKKQRVSESSFNCPGVPSLSEAKMAIAHRSYARLNAESTAEEIQGARERGAENNLKLRNRYETKLEAYKAVQDRNGPLSGFAKRELRLAQEPNPSDLEQEAPKPSTPGLGGLGIGFARFKSDNLAIEA